MRKRRNEVAKSMFVMAENLGCSVEDFVQSLSICGTYYRQHEVNERYKKILYHYLSPMNDVNNEPTHTLKEVGQIIGLSSERTRQIVWKVYRAAKKHYEMRMR